MFIWRSSLDSRLLFNQNETEELNRIAKDCGLDIMPLKDLAVCDF